MRDSGQKEYASSSDDVHANFKRVAGSLNISKEKALMVYLLKHIDGISSYIDGNKSQREDVTGRIIDAIVYLFLLYSLINSTTALYVVLLLLSPFTSMILLESNRSECFHIVTDLFSI